jgi:hypothetical protein
LSASFAGGGNTFAGGNGGRAAVALPAKDWSGKPDRQVVRKPKVFLLLGASAQKINVNREIVDT